MNVKTLKRDGVRYVLVPERAFRKMKADSEDLADIRAFDEAVATPQEFIPASMVERMLKGESPVRVYREYRGFTQEVLADKAGISKPFLSQIENGARSPSLATAKKLAKALNLDVDDLV